MDQESTARSETPPRSSHAAYVQIDTPDGQTIYTGEAIYRPQKPHPLTGKPLPTIGIPDDAMPVRPSSSTPYDVWYNGERIPTTAVYLERVATCWWFVLAKPPRHPPTR